MNSIVRTVNAYFKIATKADVDELLSKIILSDRQLKIFEMFYIKRQNVNFIADTLYMSVSAVNVELDRIRNKIMKFI